MQEVNVLSESDTTESVCEQNIQILSSSKNNITAKLSEQEVELVSSTEKNETDVRGERHYDTPKQSEVSARITSISLDISCLEAKKSKDLATDDELKRLKSLISEKTKCEKKLSVLKSNQKSAQKVRANQKARISEIEATNPEISAKLKKRSAPGKPRVEEKQPELLRIITDIATYGGAADDRRRSETIRSVKTLNELTKELIHLGFTVRFLK